MSVIERLQSPKYSIKTLPEFTEWLNALKVKPTLIRLVRGWTRLSVAISAM